MKEFSLLKRPVFAIEPVNVFCGEMCGENRRRLDTKTPKLLVFVAQNKNKIIYLYSSGIYFNSFKIYKIVLLETLDFIE